MAVKNHKLSQAISFIAVFSHVLMFFNWHSEMCINHYDSIVATFRSLLNYYN